MINIKFYTTQDYDKYIKSPSKISFIDTEKSLIQHICSHFCNTINENLLILEQLKGINLDYEKLIEFEVNGEYSYYLIEKAII